jgi:hypothetical protein
MVWPDNIDSGRSNSELGDRSRCRHCNLIHLLSIHSLKHAAVSSADQGGGKRRADIAVVSPQPLMHDQPQPMGDELEDEGCEAR